MDVVQFLTASQAKAIIDKDPAKLLGFNHIGRDGKISESVDQTWYVEIVLENRRPLCLMLDQFLELAACLRTSIC